MNRFPEAVINDEHLRDYCQRCLAAVPEYFWTMPASTSLKYHQDDNGVGGCVQHTRKALVAAKEMRYILALTDDEFDLVQVALVLHDSFKCGVPPNVKYVGGRVCTTNDHPLCPRIGLKSVHVPLTYEPKVNFIFCMIDGHSGIWSPNRSLYPFHEGAQNLQRAEQLIVFVHMCDMIASRKSFHIDLVGQ